MIVVTFRYAKDRQTTVLGTIPILQSALKSLPVPETNYHCIYAVTKEFNV
jgi:hypothetical protein